MTDRETCSQWRPLLDAFADGELDAAHALGCEEHFEACAACASMLRSIRATRAALAAPGLRHAAPVSLRARIEAALAAERSGSTAGRRRSPPAAGTWRAGLGRWSLASSAGLLAASLLVMTLTWRAVPGLEAGLVESHVRSLQVSHLTDVATSDQHTVKPWFNGKVDFAPPVVDLSGQGFPLAGGRLDYVAGRPVAALVYRRNGHLINLFIWPASDAQRRTVHRDGYNLLGWAHAGLAFWAVSDLGANELSRFRQAFEETDPDNPKPPPR
ncbi:anti-sigma factor [Alsobacter sp. KACC 23698]|uniref:Anti-sigma factor n=1 Tax=Alsobacter sp. KACC 23698 TaxID=3149229 RepID=A0AAU7JJC1_9HYPH